MNHILRLFGKQSRHCALLLFIPCLVASGQPVSQTVKGTVTDKDSQVPLIGATVMLPGTSPVDQSRSFAAKDVVYDEQRAFEDRKPVTWYLDFSASWQRNKPQYASTWSFQFVNMLFQKEFYGYRYNLRTNTVDPLMEAVVIPNISYRIDF
jgi:hypothetical protein